MSWLLTTRALPGGGPVAPIQAYANPPDSNGVLMNQLIGACKGKDVLIATHGFNVNQEEGIAHLAQWEPLLSLPGEAVYVGLLWPGDSVWLHALIYPEAAKVAKQAGDELSSWLNKNLAGAASLSFVSHSLGARVVLETIGGLDSSFQVRRLLLMAGAIDANCLGSEYAAAAKRVQKISNLASRQDDVLKWAFPLGNPISGLFADGHPFWKAAIGREGPTASPPAPAQFDKRCMMPPPWGYGHDAYLPPPTPMPVSAAFAMPVNDPVPVDAEPAAYTPAAYVNAPSGLDADWKGAWTAGFESTRLG